MYAFIINTEIISSYFWLLSFISSNSPKELLNSKHVLRHSLVL